MQGIVLKRLGHNVHILEQKPSSALADLGAGIKVGPDAQEFFKNHDLVHEPYYVRCPGFQLVDNDSNVKRFDEQPMRMSSWSVLHHRLRANYDGYKSDFCPNPPVRSESDGDAVYDIGKKVTSLAHDKNGRVKIGFTDMINGGLEHFVWGDLVIAADGQSSTVRRMVMPEVKRTYAGYVGWRGFVPEQELSQETREVLDPRSSAFVFPGGYIIR